jgi:hypothetical protein
VVIEEAIDDHHRNERDKEYDMMNLSGETALETGASRGIGRAIAWRLASDGALVGIHYGNNKTAANAALAEIERAGNHAFTTHAEFGVGRPDCIYVLPLHDEQGSYRGFESDARPDIGCAGCHRKYGDTSVIETAMGHGCTALQVSRRTSWR